MSNLITPCVVLEGVTSQQELNYLEKAFSEEGENKIPFYLKAFGKFKRLGNIELDVDNVLNLNYISEDYKIWLYHDGEHKVLLDQNNDETLIKLIKL